MREIEAAGDKLTGELTLSGVMFNMDNSKAERTSLKEMSSPVPKSEIHHLIIIFLFPVQFSILANQAPTLK